VEAAAAAGKAILCEKPLATDIAAARQAVEAAQSASRPHAIGFNYRRLPAISLLKRLVEDGAIGEVRLWPGPWLSDEFAGPAIPFDWRFERSLGGTTIADLGSHLVDLALWTVGGVASVSAQSTTFARERTDPATTRPRAVEIDDASSALMRF